MKRFAALAVLALALVPTASASLPFATVAHTEQLILNSQFADRNAITDVTCVGLTQPKPKASGGAITYHRFRCHISGAYFDIQAIVVLTGNGGFNVHPLDY